MKSFYSLPEDSVFFNRYASLVPTLFKLGFLAQIVSACTEIGIIYNQVDESLTDFWPANARLGAALAALVGTAFIEIGLRKFTPYSVRAILYKRFSGLDLAMSLVILIATVALFVTSGLLSFGGSKSMVAAIAPEATQVSTDSIDNAFAQDEAVAIQLFRRDSSEIAKRFTVQINSIDQATASKIKVQRNKLQRYIDLERKTDKSYISSKRRIEGVISQLEAERDEKIVGLTSEGAKELATVAQVRKSAIDSAIHRQQQGKSIIIQENQQAKTDNQNKIDNYGGGLAWFTVICLFVFALSVALKEIHQKGSGIEEQVMPTQYDFSDSILGELLNAISNRFQQFARSKIYEIEAATPSPPVPAPPAGLYNLAKLEQPIFDLVFDVDTQQTLLISNGSPLGPGTSAQQLEEIALHYYEAAANLQSYGLDAKAKELQLKADDILRMYLGKAATTDAVAQLRQDCVNFLSGKSSNPFARHHPRPIGFNYTGKNQASVNNATVNNSNKGGLESKSCFNCGKEYQPKVAWQKYCSTDCKEEFHSKKHGGVKFDRNLYKKKKKK